MGLIIYFIIYAASVYFYFVDNQLYEYLLMVGMIVPVSNYIYVIYKLKGFSWYETLKASGFQLLSIMNFLSFTYCELPLTYKYLMYVWMIFAFLFPIYLKRKQFMDFSLKITVYFILLGFTIFNAQISQLQRMTFYTLGNPFYATAISVNRLYDFAFLYNKINDDNHTYFLLNRCKEEIKKDLDNQNVSDNEKDILKMQYDIIEKSTILVMQGNWNKKEDL